MVVDRIITCVRIDDRPTFEFPDFEIPVPAVWIVIHNTVYEKGPGVNQDTSEANLPSALWPLKRGLVILGARYIKITDRGDRHIGLTVGFDGGADDELKSKLERTLTAFRGTSTMIVITRNRHL
jgi:hypothetical protein